MSRFSISLILLLIPVALVSADQSATAEDGTEVILRDDGTWIAVAPTMAATMQISPASPDFRSVRWGMSKADVRGTENKTPTEGEDGTLLYEDNVLGLPALTFYQFTQEKLTSAGYLFQAKHYNENDTILDFFAVNVALEDKYKAEGEDRTKWRSGASDYEKDRYGMAVSLGDLTLEKQWETKESTIVHRLTGENFQTTHILIYRSKELQNLVEKQHDNERQKEVKTKL